MAEVSFDDVARSLIRAEWIFAKTMPHNPHWYTLRKKWTGPALFEDVVAYIREHGYTYRFGRRDYLQLNINDHYYWTMGAPLAETILINRKPITPDFTEYDRIAESYDGLFDGEEYREEEAQLAEMLADIPRPILDIGCGTGLLIDILKPHPEEYFGIDPSTMMLGRLKARYPLHGVKPWKLEQAYISPPYGSAVSLFGSASYIDPSALSRIPDVAKSWFLMFFSPGYQPVTHTKTGINPPILSTYEAVPGRRREFGNYIIVEGAK